MTILKKKLDKLQEGGFVIPMTNIKSVSLMVIVPKKGGKWHICINYKALNKMTKKDRQPLLFVDELLNDVACHDIYIICDGHSGYHQIKIHEDDILKTTFTTPWGTFAYIRMPFGLCNVQNTFQRVQTKVFTPYIGKFIIVYLDNFAIFGSKDVHMLLN